MSFNYYEKQNKRASIASIIDEYNLNCIICNSIVDVESDSIEKISYVVYDDIDNDTKEEIYYNHLCFDDHVSDFENVDQAIKDDIEYAYNHENEYYQYYIIPADDVEYWNLVGHDVFYHDALDCFFMGVNHFGTAWDYILTDIPLISGNTGLEIDTDYIHDHLKHLI